MPKFYLRGFADDREWITTLRLPGDKSYTQSIENSAALKHFFDTVYYPCLDTVAGRPYGLWVHGNNDTAGAVKSVQKIVTGMELVQSAQIVEVTGPIDAAVRESCYELGATIAVTVAGDL